MSSAAAHSICSTVGNCRPSMAKTSSWSRTMSALGWAKTVRIAAATISAEPLGPGPGRCARSGPGSAGSRPRVKTACAAPRRPVWASAMTSCTREAAGPERPQERGPERARLAVSDGGPDDLAAAGGGHPGRDHDGLGDDPPVHPRLAVGRIQEHIRERLSGQGPVGERGHLVVEVGADPGHLGLGDPGVRAPGLDRVVDRPRGHAVQVGLHHHRDSAWSTRRRRSNSDGKNDPVRSLGIRGSRSPAVVVDVRGRCPSPRVSRLSVRSWGRRRSPWRRRRAAPGTAPGSPAGSGRRRRRPWVRRAPQVGQSGPRPPCALSFRENHWRGSR
jgi:hypothetical protein